MTEEERPTLTPQQRKDAWQGLAILTGLVLGVTFLFARPHLHDAYNYIFIGDEPRALCPSGYPEPCADSPEALRGDSPPQPVFHVPTRENCDGDWRCLALGGVAGGWVMVDAGGGLPSDILVWDGQGHCQLLNHPNVSLYGTEFEWMKKCIKGPGR